jgi:hypothetical protein
LGFVFLCLSIWAALNYESLGLDFLYRFAIIFDTDEGNASVLNRMDGIYEVFEYIKNSSRFYVNGEGAGGFVSRLRIAEVIDYPHNIFAEVIFEFGFAGLIALIAYIFMGLNIMRNSHGFVIFLIAIALAMVSGDLVDNRVLFLTPFLGLKFKEAFSK